MPHRPPAAVPPAHYLLARSRGEPESVRAAVLPLPLPCLALLVLQLTPELPTDQASLSLLSPPPHQVSPLLLLVTLLVPPAPHHLHQHPETARTVACVVAARSMLLIWG